MLYSPYVHYLHSLGKLVGTIGPRGSAPFFFYSPNHTEVDIQRHFCGGTEMNRYRHAPTLHELLCLTPAPLARALLLYLQEGGQQSASYLLARIAKPDPAACRTALPVQWLSPFRMLSNEAQVDASHLLVIS